MVLSALTIKGALFLAKTGSAKLLAIITAKYGVAGAATVATAVGGAAVVASIPENAKLGFERVVGGVSNGSFADFMDGLYHLGKTYTTATGMMDDLFALIDSGDFDPDVKVNLKKSVESLKPLIINEIEHKSYELLKECEEYLRERGVSSEEYLNEIKRIYIQHTFDVEDDYRELLGRGGRIYDGISSLNKKFHIITPNEFDHYLVYCMAGWMIDNLQLSCIRNVSQKKLAGDITDNIFTYLRYMNK